MFDIFIETLQALKDLNRSMGGGRLNEPLKVVFGATGTSLIKLNSFNLTFGEFNVILSKLFDRSYGPLDSLYFFTVTPVRTLLFG